jgi:hypothetical protein
MECRSRKPAKRDRKSAATWRPHVPFLVLRLAASVVAASLPWELPGVTC